MDLNDSIQKRKSVKSYKDKKPDWRDIIECVDAARYTPMAGNNYSLKFIIIDEPETIQKLANASQQPFIAKAPYIIAVCTNPVKTKNLFEERADRYLHQQAGAAIQTILLKLTEKELASCWIGHYVDYLVKETLKISKDVRIEALITVGYEHIKTAPKRKPILDGILYFNKYKNKKMKNPRRFSV